MTPQEAFKLGFLARCVEENLSHEKIAEVSEAFYKSANPLDFISKPATKVLENVLDLGKDVTRLGAAGLVAAPPALGASIAYLSNKAQEPGKDELKELQNQELIDEYRKATMQLNQQKALRSYKQQRNKSKSIYL